LGKGRDSIPLSEQMRKRGREGGVGLHIPYQAEGNQAQPNLRRKERDQGGVGSYDGMNFLTEEAK